MSNFKAEARGMVASKSRQLKYRNSVSMVVVPSVKSEPLNGTAPVSHDCYLKLFFLGDHEIAGADRTLLLDEAQDADPVILGLVKRHPGPRVLVGDSYQQLYQWRGAVNALSNANVETAVMPLTQTFRFGHGAARWANRLCWIGKSWPSAQ